MPKSKFNWLMVVIIFIGAALPLSLSAQKSKLPSNIYFVGTVNGSFGNSSIKTVKCYLDLTIRNGQVSGYTNYDANWEEPTREVHGTVKAKSNGTYHFDIYIADNSGFNFEGTYNPTTGIFSGKSIGRGMDNYYPFKFTRKTK